MVGIVLDGLRLVDFRLDGLLSFLPRWSTVFQKIRRTTPRKELPALLISVPRYALRLPRPRAGAAVAGAGAGVSSTRLTSRVGLTRPGRR